MRQIDWDKRLSETDKTWLRQSGIAGHEEAIRANEERFGEDPSAPDILPDPLTKSALDPEARTSRTPSEAPPSGAPSDVQGVGAPSEPDDDYDEWKMPELTAEVNKRNEDETNEDKIVVVGTGTGGNVLKKDVIDALRAWDRAHPESGEDV